MVVSFNKKLNSQNIELKQTPTRDRAQNYTILFEELEEIILSKFSYKITSFIDFSPYTQMFSELNNYAQKLKINPERYVNDFRSYPSYQKTGDLYEIP